LVEVAIATFLMGLVMVAAMGSLGAAIKNGDSTSRNGQAVLLADSLMSEIVRADYLEPDDDPQWGIEGNAEGSGTRAAFDDVDDYDDWDALPPQAKNGTELPDRDGWRRTVTVKHVDPDNLAIHLADNDDRGVKLIVVEVKYDGELLATQYAVQTEAWLDMIPEPGNDQTTGSMPPVNQPPTAVATGNPLSGTGQVTVQFDATGSTDPNGDPLMYSWDFGDGGTGSGSKPSHTFTNSGDDTLVRTVTLTATDTWGGQDTATLTVTIY